MQADKYSLAYVVQEKINPGLYQDKSKIYQFDKWGEMVVPCSGF